jgi:hypothetical protein
MAVEADLERGGDECAAAGAVAIGEDNDKPANKADTATPPKNATQAFFSSLLIHQACRTARTASDRVRS